MRLPIGLVILATSPYNLAAGQGELETTFTSALQLILELFGFAAGLVVARWLYDWSQCRKATRAATTAVKERVGSGQKPYC